MESELVHGGICGHGNGRGHLREKRTEKSPCRRRILISLISIVRILQAHRHIGGKRPRDGDGFADEVSFVQVRALRDVERVCVIDGDAHDFAELGGCAGKWMVAFRPSTTNEFLCENEEV